MKLMHISDLHIGKKVNEFSMIEDQKYILAEIIKIADNLQPDGILIAGDVYDRNLPSAEAVELFDQFLVELANRKIHVFVISGNHDSPERLAFGGRLMDASGIHMSPVYSGNVSPVTLTDDYGKVNFYMLPFIKPAHARRFFPYAEIDNYTDAVHAAVEQMDVDASYRNILITHQFVTGAEKCESEEISVGGSDNVDASVFEGFDYVALGHIHGPQNIAPNIRYCGTPLKYSFSEANHKKSVTIIELGKKGDMSVSKIPLTPLRDMAEIKGSYAELSARSYYDGTTLKEDYVHVTLTDEEDIPDAIGRLRSIYHNLMKLDYDNKRTRGQAQLGSVEDMEQKSELDLFSEFYEKQNNAPMSDKQRQYMISLIERIKEESL